MFSRGKTIAGALVLLALSICALGAANASASPGGLTAVTCEEVPAFEGEYNNSHCLTPKSIGNFETVALIETAVEGESVTAEEKTGSTEKGKPTAILKANIAGLAVEVTCGNSSLTGYLSNFVVSGEMKIHGTNTVINHRECHASLQSNTSKICNVEGTTGGVGVGQIQTRTLTTTTSPEHVVTVEPELLEGGKAVLAKFNILNTGTECPFKKAVAVTLEGRVKGIANTETHSHLTFTPSNNGVELKANGATATYESTITTWRLVNPEETVGAQTFE